VRVDAIGMMAISRIGRRHWRCCDDVEVHIGSDLSCFDKGLLVIVSRSIVSRSSWETFIFNAPYTNWNILFDFPAML